MKKTVLYTLGVIFLALGIIGFFNDPVFGIFDVDTEHNIIHLLSGIAAIYFASQSYASMRTFGIVMAVVYGLVSILGLLFPNSQVLGFISINDADNILHVLLTVAFLYVGFAKDETVEELPRGALHHR